MLFFRVSYLPPPLLLLTWTTGPASRPAPPGLNNRTVEANEGAKPGIVDDYKKMSDDFAHLVEKMVR